MDMLQRLKLQYIKDHNWERHWIDSVKNMVFIM